MKCKYLVFYVACLLLSIVGCEIKKDEPKIDSYRDKCVWLNHDKQVLTELFKNEYAQSVSDSFIYSLYFNNYKTKIRKEHNVKDSVSILELEIVPKLVSTPRGDSDVYEVVYAFTDAYCSAYYDSVLRSYGPIIYGFRFSISERRVICYLSSDGKLSIDSAFMDFQEKTNQQDFIKVVGDNMNTIRDEKLKLFFKHLSSQKRLRHGTLR